MMNHCTIIMLYYPSIVVISACGLVYILQLDYSIILLMYNIKITKSRLKNFKRNLKERSFKTDPKAIKLLLNIQETARTWKMENILTLQNVLSSFYVSMKVCTLENATMELSSQQGQKCVISQWMLTVKVGI